MTRGCLVISKELIRILDGFLKDSLYCIGLFELSFQDFIHFLFVYDVLFLIFRVLIGQNNLNYLHTVVLNFLQSSLGLFIRFPSVIVLLPDYLIPILKLIFLEVVLQVRQEPSAVFTELSKHLRSLNINQHVTQLSDFLLAQSILMDQGLSKVHQTYDLLVDLFLQNLDFPLVLLDQFELFHGIHRFINVLCKLLKGTFQQPFDQEGDIL